MGDREREQAPERLPAQDDASAPSEVVPDIDPTQASRARRASAQALGAPEQDSESEVSGNPQAQALAVPDGEMIAQADTGGGGVLETAQAVKGQTTKGAENPALEELEKLAQRTELIADIGKIKAEGKFATESGKYNFSQPAADNCPGGALGCMRPAMEKAPFKFRVNASKKMELDGVEFEVPTDVTMDLPFKLVLEVIVGIEVFDYMRPGEAERYYNHEMQHAVDAYKMAHTLLEGFNKFAGTIFQTQFSQWIMDGDVSKFSQLKQVIGEFMSEHIYAIRNEFANYIESIDIIEARHGAEAHMAEIEEIGVDVSGTPIKPPPLERGAKGFLF